ncbi:ADL329Wp [Eremothecium gossypii ATCC 10895]|uniref:ADL329Wp n=1 Tax=Eremothecium gossypii (strain ATCC 10895 / CBS 109.51 / FGSC 9923 / NRRL Y-1056) TaxID=284811 RepID=Q75BH6_EREGS|nr:ADL329Wp [Eremothecium gossypii ATCC 10895]AAS51591.2 ADL329Wp [Eremothecium gossypii ATCC 10895]AEY95887.1 FADL329Wp [Eremothecium gossypii FDAG1]
MALHNVRRADLTAQYTHVLAPDTAYTGASQGVVSQSMPMLAMFMRNKFLAWFSLLTAWHTYLTADPNAVRDREGTEVGPIMKLGMAVVAVVVCYTGMVLPQPAPGAKR